MTCFCMPQEGNCYFSSGSGEFCCFSPEISDRDFLGLDAASGLGTFYCRLAITGAMITSTTAIALWALGFSPESIATAVAIPATATAIGLAGAALAGVFLLVAAVCVYSVMANRR